MITNKQGRYYKIGEEMLPSVTTVLGILNKPALVPWAAKVTAEAFRDMVKAVAFKDGFTEEVVDSMVDAAKKAHREQSKAAMTHGTRVHEAIAYWVELFGEADIEQITLYLADKFPGTAEDITKAVAGFTAWRVWGDEVNLEILESEQVVSDNELFAGRYDLLAKVDGVTTLIDIKTSTGIWDEYWLQTAAYASCIDPLPEAIAILRIDKNDGTIEYKSKNRYALHTDAFKAVARAYHAQLKTKGE